MELYSQQTRITCLIILLIIYVTGIFGNILLIWTICSTKLLRSIHNMIVAILAVADLLMVAYLLPFNMKVLISNRIPDLAYCRFQAVIFFVLFGCCIQLIMLVALARYFKICRGHTFVQVFTVRNVIIAVVAMCVIAAIFASFFWFYDSLWTFEISMHTCIFNRFESAAFSNIAMGVFLGIPIVVTTSCYIEIYRHVRKAELQLNMQWMNGFARPKLAYENNVTKSQFALFALHLMMYLPFAITAVIGQRDDYPEFIHTVSIYLCYTNSSVNSFIYGALNKRIKIRYFEILSCVKQTKKRSARVAPTVTGNISLENVSSRVTNNFLISDKTISLLNIGKRVIPNHWLEDSSGEPENCSTSE